MKSKSDVEQRILQCIDDGLQTLGEGGKQAIYYYLEKNLGLKKEEIPKKPEVFCNGLNSIFGKEGTNLIDRWIVEKLKRNFALKAQSKISLAEAIAKIKASQSKPKEILKDF